MIDKFKVGHWYRFEGAKDPEYWHENGMDFVLDGKPLLCIDSTKDNEADFLGHLAGPTMDDGHGWRWWRSSLPQPEGWTCIGEAGQQLEELPPVGTYLEPSETDGAFGSTFTGQYKDSSGVPMLATYTREVSRDDKWMWAEWSNGSTNNYPLSYFKLPTREFFEPRMFATPSKVEAKAEPKPEPLGIVTIDKRVKALSDAAVLNIMKADALRTLSNLVTQNGCTGIACKTCVLHACKNALPGDVTCEDGPTVHKAARALKARYDALSKPCEPEPTGPSGEPDRLLDAVDWRTWWLDLTDERRSKLRAGFQKYLHSERLDCEGIVCDQCCLSGGSNPERGFSCDALAKNAGFQSSGDEAAMARIVYDFLVADGIYGGDAIAAAHPRSFAPCPVPVNECFITDPMTPDLLALSEAFTSLEVPEYSCFTVPSYEDILKRI
jgi:hypothetical protein